METRADPTLPVSRAAFVATVTGAFGVLCFAFGVYSVVADQTTLGVFVVVGLLWLAAAGNYYRDPESIPRGTKATPRYWVELVVVVVVSVSLGTGGLFVFVEPT